MQDASRDQLRVSAHVLVQLGAELVTDVEQAILECVKNAYDADSEGCRIEIDTRAENILTERAPASALRQHQLATETVAVRLLDVDGKELSASAALDSEVVRELTCRGRITISDNGTGIEPSKISSSWLMISGSAKRTEPDSPKVPTAGGRTPLGDKGLGRLGTMKLGDVLQVESALGPNAPVSVARFRWKDCDSALSVDQVPVHSFVRENKERLKGTRVSVFGLNDLRHWRKPGRVDEIAQSLARLVSPFEATTTFPVVVTLDGHEHSLMAVTDQVLNQAVAEFTFEWKRDGNGERALLCRAKFKKSLFGETRKPESKARYEAVFGEDGGTEFLGFLERFSKTKAYKKSQNQGQWLVVFEREIKWTDLLLKGESISDPGSFGGAFYFFHLDTMEKNAPSGLAISRSLVKDMSGISILRDGFQVRSKNDWLGLAAGMTAGSTYHMRVNNTLGYFALSGAENYKLTEKSDREGFVEDAAYRGFYTIAASCRKFANDSLEGIRRAFDAFYKSLSIENDTPAAESSSFALKRVSEAFEELSSIKSDADSAAAFLAGQVADLERGDSGSKTATATALSDARKAQMLIARVQKSVAGADAPKALSYLTQEAKEQREQLFSMVESAAVGLSARGLAHELRTHLGDIRHRLTQITKQVDGRTIEGREIQRHVQSIRGSCSSIMSAASTIDPLLPRSRALKDTFLVSDFIAEYIEHRRYIFDREGVAVHIERLGDLEVSVNRSRVLQVLENLTSNSRYWLARGELAGTLVGPKSISIQSSVSGFSVGDSGPGVDPHYESSLFDLFVSNKPDGDSGQGLGLFICRQLLAADGCSIELEPERNSRGRLFKFSVNLSAVRSK